MTSSMTLSPEQAARIADDAYEVSSAGISRAMQMSKGLSLKDTDGSGFQRPDERLMGQTGFLKKSAGFGFVAEGDGGSRKGQYLVAMRGTMGAKGVSRDWQTNYCAYTKQSKGGHKVHGGFQSVFNDIEPDLKAYFKGKRGTVHCVGHSLGGALATLSADYLHEMGDFDIKLYTFGAPRVGLEDFCRNLTKKIKQENMFRMFHTTDPVPMIAPYPYIHAPFTGMDRLNWGIRIEKPGRIVPDDHGMDLYVKTASKVATWGALSANNMEAHTPWEVWLKDAAASKINGVIQFGASVFDMISKCIQGIIKQVLSSVNSALLAGMNFIDQLAWLLYRGALASEKIAWYLKSLIQVIFKFLGRSYQSGTSITHAFIRWVFDLLYSSVQILGKKAIQLVGH